MTQKPTDAERRQIYLRQKMDASVQELQRRLLGPEGIEWHELLKSILEHEKPEELSSLLKAGAHAH